MGIVLTNSAKFKPYTFDELLKPYIMATAEYNKIEEGLTTLGSEAEKMRQYALQEPDAEFSKKYLAYADALDKEADNLAKNGLTGSNRTNWMKLKKQYSSDVAPLENAVKKREELYKIIHSNPNNLYRNNGIITLDDVINNRVDMSYLDEKTLMTEASIGAKAEGQKAMMSVLNNNGTFEQGIIAAGKAIEDYKNIYLNDVGINDFSSNSKDRINKAIGLGTQGALSDIIKEGSTESRARESINMQKRQLDSTELHRQIELASKGLKLENGKIVEDKDSEYWKKKGIKFDKNGRKVYETSEGTMTDVGAWYELTRKDGTVQLIPKNPEYNIIKDEQTGNIKYVKKSANSNYQINDYLEFNDQGLISNVVTKATMNQILKDATPVSYSQLVLSGAGAKAISAATEGIEGSEDLYVFYVKGKNVIRGPRIGPKKGTESTNESSVSSVGNPLVGTEND